MHVARNLIEREVPARTDPSHRIVEIVGRRSMPDIFVGAMVVLTMPASQCLDLRLPWTILDQTDERT
ncbi:hypothetical protein PMI16_01065 [Herbaspirillum sp. CF444]|uniref:hypothetical protein n=1 Tax=Herbaspirillum sp. CF444 TaxID=1144319 RepID=UPI000272736C|nr:hypothetical protein [Herbaspirillum sp. CF444]EJL92401.1 hypothetical protein PMI16_01065 [Herbaspirillum sp. CF444]